MILSYGLSSQVSFRNYWQVSVVLSGPRYVSPPFIFRDFEPFSFSFSRSQLTMSIAKKICIIDVTRSIARASSGMEVDTAHWSRMAFVVSRL